MIREILTTGPLDAVVQVPGSKSITNRALICAALARGVSYIRNASDSDDTRRLVNGLNQLGVLVRWSDDVLTVEGTGGRLFAPRYPIPVGNAGTTLRFLCGVAALAQGSTVFTTDIRMQDRPMDDLLEPLKALGVEVRRGGGALGISIGGGGLDGGEVAVRSSRSSQFLSALLLVAPCARASLRILEEEIAASRPYVDMTIEVMARFGVEIRRPGGRSYHVSAGGGYRPADFTVEADASGASYFYAAAAIAGGAVQVRDISPLSMQADVGFVNILSRMGCTVEAFPEGVRVRGTSPLQGIDIDMNGMPDVVPTLAVAALFGTGPTRIRNIAHLRYKESDRLEALAEELARTGARVEIAGDGLAIAPAGLHGAQLDTHEDHRLAMSFALIGLRVPGIRIENPGVVGKSFPKFWTEFEKLGSGRGQVG
jgi:3-phosphoshikimate 1-carboxyvinyltransferase